MACYSLNFTPFFVFFLSWTDCPTRFKVWRIHLGLRIAVSPGRSRLLSLHFSPVCLSAVQPSRWQWHLRYSDIFKAGQKNLFALNKSSGMETMFYLRPFPQAVMVNALIAYYTNRQRRNSTAAANASSDEIDGGIHGEQDLDGESPNEIDRLPT